MSKNRQQFVIFKHLDNYCVTTNENYKAKISNERLINLMRGFKSPVEIIDYYCKYFDCKETDFIVIGE